MKNKFETLADVRNKDPENFDRIIRDAVFAAAKSIGTEATIKAICGSGK